MNPPLLIVGMRRNGTTILHDAFVRDRRFTTLYEPLAKVDEHPTIGGGSGSHDTDLFDEVRSARMAFLAERSSVNDVASDDLNHGGPLRPEVEDDPELPAVVREYLAFVFDRAPRPVVAKFVRMNHKLAALHQLVPDGVLVWTIRDPKSVVRSYLFGRGDKTLHRFPDADAFFDKRTQHDPWSVRRLSEAARAAGVADVDDPSDLERVLLVWKHTVSAMEAGAQHFGDQAFCLRHEDTSTNARATMTDLHERIEIAPDPDVLDWYTATVRPPGETPYPTDPRWEQAFTRVGLVDLAERFGYA